MSRMSSDPGSLSDSETGAVGGGGGASGVGDEAEVEKSFSAQTISLRAQKKLIGKLAGSQKAVKIFVDATSARAFDGIYKLAKRHSRSRTRAQKLMKQIVKLNMKVGMLYMQDILDNSEKALADQFRDKFNDLATALVRMQRGRQPVDTACLARQFRDCESLVLRIVRRHLSEKSHASIRACTDFFTQPAFLRALFDPSSELAPIMAGLSEDIQELLDRGIV